MRVALLNPPWRRPGCYGVRAGSRWPHFESADSRYMPYPFMLGYTAALLENGGFQMALFDGCATKEADEDYERKVVAFEPDVIVQENATASIAVDLAWAARLERRTKAFVLMTGHHVPHMARALDEHAYLGALAGGEWEYTVLEACERLRAGEPLSGTAGLTHRDGCGQTVVEERRPNIDDLDRLPWPHRATLDMARYYDNPGDLPAPCLQLHGSRGCPYRCNFCVWPQVVYEDHRYRTRSAKSMADEIEGAFRPAGRQSYRSYYFDDDTFNIGEPRMNELADELIGRGLEHIPWGAMCRTDTIGKRTLANLRRAGLSAVKYGVESGDQELLQRCGKRLDLDNVRDMVRFSHELGIKTHLTFCFGLLGETRSSMQRTLDLALELDPHTLQFSLCTPFPGTELYEMAADQQLLLTRDFAAYDGSSRCVARTEHLTAAELEGFLAHARRSWHRHEAQRGMPTLRRVLRDPRAAFRKALRNPRRALQFASDLISTRRRWLPPHHRP